MKHKVGKVTYFLALLALLASLLLYLGTYSNIGITTSWPIGLTVSVAIFVITPLTFWAVHGLKPDVAYNVNQWPKWLLLILAVAILNVFIVEGTPAPGKWQGVTEVRDGHYFIVAHGRTLSELTYEDYRLRETYDTRQWSAFFMVWYLICALQSWTAAFGKSLRDS